MIPGKGQYLAGDAFIQSTSSKTKLAKQKQMMGLVWDDHLYSWLNHHLVLFFTIHCCDRLQSKL